MGLAANRGRNLMKIRGWMKWAAVAAVVCGLTGGLLIHRAQAAAALQPQGSGGFPHRGRLLEKLASLGITDQQRDQIRSILQEARPKAEPLMKQLVAERRALRSLILNGASEVDVRAQAAKVAKAGADLAVLRAQVAPKIREVLTPEQRQKLQEMLKEMDSRVDTAIHDASGTGTE